MNIEDIEVGQRYWTSQGGMAKSVLVVAKSDDYLVTKEFLGYVVRKSSVFLCEDDTDRRPWWQRWLWPNREPPRISVPRRGGGFPFPSSKYTHEAVAAAQDALQKMRSEQPRLATDDGITFTD